MIFPQEEFVYNNSINRSTSKSPFQIVYGSSLKNASKLMQLDKGEISSAKAEKIVEHLKNIREEVRKHIIKMTMQCKAMPYVKIRYKEIQVGDEFMVHLRKENFQVGT